MHPLRSTMSCLLLIGGAVAASAQIVRQKGGYLINVKYTNGQVLKQNLEMHLVGDTKKHPVSLFITKCLGVDKKGIATLDVTVPTAGKTPSVKKRIKVDRHGKPQGATIDGYSGSFVWPEMPIKVGQSWLGDMSVVGPGNGGMKLKSTYKLTGIKTVNGVKVASIASVMNVTGTYEISGTGILYVRFSDGQLQNAEFNLALNQFSDTNAKGKLKVVMTIRTLP